MAGAKITTRMTSKNMIAPMATIGFFNIRLNLSFLTIYITLLQSNARIENTGKDISIIAADTDRDNWMSAEEAKEYGLIDRVIYKRSEA